MTAATLTADNGASSGTSGIKYNGGNDGTLQIQTTTSGGTATTALTINNSQVVSLANALPVASGGTGLTSTPTNGQLDIGNGTGFTRTTLTAGTGISITNGSGSISIAATGGGTVTSVATGNGLTGGPITGSGTISLDIYYGGSSTNTTYPIGTYLTTNDNNLNRALNSTSSLYSNSGGKSIWTYNPGGSGVFSLAGTWSLRGTGSTVCSINFNLFQRTA